VVQSTIFDERPGDSTLLIPAIQRHIEQFGPAPQMAAADAGCGNAVGLAPWGRVEVPAQDGRVLRVTGTPAQHRPEGMRRLSRCISKVAAFRRKRQRLPANDRIETAPAAQLLSSKSASTPRRGSPDTVLTYLGSLNQRATSAGCTVVQAPVNNTASGQIQKSGRLPRCTRPGNKPRSGSLCRLKSVSIHAFGSRNSVGAL
jgi:hypothetical protein